MSLSNGETYFNNFVQTGYEEISEWTPRFYRDIMEADVNMKFAGSLDDLMAQSLEDWCKNQFAAGMNEETLSRMERFFYMEDNASLDINERRRLLAIAMAGTGKINTAKIADYVRTYTGAESTFEFLHHLYIYVHLGEDDRTGDTQTLMEKLGQKIPAHLAYTAQFQTELVFDWRDLEDINLTKLHIGMKFPYLYTQLLDGSWILDGTNNLTGGERIGLGASVDTKFSFENAQGISVYPGVVIPVKTNENVSETIGILLSVETDGAFDIGAGIRYETETEEDVPRIEMAKMSADCWFLDGSVTLNGAETLDSIYEKEVIE